MENKFINLEKNDNFSHFRGIDLQELLVETENCFLEYRNNLNLPSTITFGIEIEYEGLSQLVVDKFIEKELSYWTSKSDLSLHFGGEIASPIMKDEIKYWQELKKICTYLSKLKADTMHNAGGHIHIGANILDKDIDAWRHFLKLYTAYENIIFRFCYGDKINARPSLHRYAPPVADIIYSQLSNINKTKTILELRDLLPIYQKKLALNFKNINFYEYKSKYIKNTLEFRSPNASINEVIWQNNINAFTKMLVASSTKVMDEEFLDYKLKYEYLPYLGNEYLYNEINLKNVLEFVDLVFDNNLDKIYFLRQYLKNFQENYFFSKTTRAKKFIK